MLVFMVFASIVALLSFILLLVGSAVSKKMLFVREKSSPFECGFSPKFNARLPFTLRFFLIAIIFLVFDVELILMFPFLINLFNLDITFLIIMVLVFICILLAGLAHEWNQGSLDWAS